jgi:hypothetical protein
MSEEPTYWATLPANVRYSDKLTPLERLLYAEITCLTNYKGYCWASNSYFSKLFNRHPKSISRNIQSLVQHDFIKIKLVRQGKNVETRIIQVVDTPPQKCYPPLHKNVTNNNKKEKESLFIEFWEEYNFKKSKKLCYNKFMKLSLEICKKCVTAAKIYTESITDIKYKKHPATWLNQGCWDDEVIINDGKIKGGKYDGMVF